MPNKFSWSYSVLTAFETCPKRFWHTRVAKDYKEVKGEAVNYGSYVHKHIENYLLLARPLPLDIQHLKKHIDNLVPGQVKPLAEQKLAINSDFEPTGWFDDDVYCRAIIDCAWIGRTTARIVDWKTGKQQNDTTQLRIMSNMMFSYYPDLENIHALFFWTKTKKATSIRQRRKDITTAWNAIFPRVARLKHAYANTEFPAKPGGLCRRHCPVRSCPHHGGTE